MTSTLSRFSSEYALGPFVVQRGVPFHIPRYTALFDAENSEDHILDVEEYKKIHVPVMNYSGASARNFFKVSHVIELTAVSFYGPWQSPTDRKLGGGNHYEIEVTLYEGLDSKTRVKAAYARQNKEFQGSELWIQFPKMTFLKMDTWYTVEFWLKGPDTMRIEEPIPTVDFEIDNFGIVQFDFLNGSRQMPKLEFWLVSERDARFVKREWEALEAEKKKTEIQAKKITRWDIFFEWVSSFFI